MFDAHIPVRELKRSRFNEKDNFRELEEIGAGSNGRCVLLERKSDRALRVCKIAQRIKRYDSKHEYEDKPLEASILLDILPQHDRILRLHEVVIQPRTIQLYYDFYSHGDLADLISHHQYNWEYIPETFMWHAYLQLAEALAFLHTGYDRRANSLGPADWQAVIHGDLKPANIFLSPPDPYSPDPLSRVYPSLVLGDFGLATTVETRYAGTLLYQPPEMPATTPKADVWALGATMHKMAHFFEPVAALPASVPDSYEHRMQWYAMPESRAVQPLYEMYSLYLHDCVFEALIFDPRGRIDSFSLYRKVQGVFSTEVMPYLDHNFEPLCPVDWEGRSYDENGVTEHKIEHPEVEFLSTVEPQDKYPEVSRGLAWRFCNI